jgi:hypothetical protein
MFFLEGCERRIRLKGNGLQLKKIGETRKTQKKVQNNFRGTPIFLQNDPIFRPKTELFKTRSLQVAIVVRVGNGSNP